VRAPRSFLVAVLSALLAGTVVAFLAMAVGAAVHGMGPWGFVSRLLAGLLIGAVIGLLAAAAALPLRATPGLAMCASGCFFFLVWVLYSVPVLHSLRTPGLLLGLGAAYGAMGAIAGWGVLRLYAWLQGVGRDSAPLAITRPIPRWALVAGGVAAIILGASVWAHNRHVYYEPKRVCERFARSFVNGNEEALTFLPYGPDPAVTPEGARNWLDRLRPLLPRGGRYALSWSYKGAQSQWCSCEVRVIGATYAIAPTSGATQARFRVIAFHFRNGWKIYRPEVPVQTYLASLYGPEAARSWQEWLVDHGTTK
jgi:hypothetical protein